MISAPNSQGLGRQRDPIKAFGDSRPAVPKLSQIAQGVGFDMLIVCGFAFDVAVGGEAKRYGNLVVMPTKMNPDLAMGDLVKKTGSGTLFMTFGEPDVDVATGKNGKVTVDINGQAGVSPERHQNDL